MYWLRQNRPALIFENLRDLQCFHNFVYFYCYIFLLHNTAAFVYFSVRILFVRDSYASLFNHWLACLAFLVDVCASVYRKGGD
jgi:hypothetical protein